MKEIIVRPSTESDESKENLSIFIKDEVEIKLSTPEEILNRITELKWKNFGKNGIKFAIFMTMAADGISRGNIYNHPLEIFQNFSTAAATIEYTVGALIVGNTIVNWFNANKDINQAKRLVMDKLQLTLPKSSTDLMIPSLMALAVLL